MGLLDYIRKMIHLSEDKDKRDKKIKKLKEEKNKLKDKNYSLFHENWVLLLKNKSAVAGLVIIGLFVLMAMFANLLATHNQYEQNIDLRLSKAFTNNYILGSDDFGRDIYSRIIFGSRISLMIGFISVGISLAIGTILGLISGYIGGWLDNIIMRVMDIMLAFPYILLAIVIVAILGASLPNAMVAIGIVGIPQFARIVRASVLAEKENEYVMAEKSLGESNTKIMLKSILPNCLAPLIVNTTLGFGNAILEAAALSFLGLGAQPPLPEWGLMLNSAREFVASAWWVVTFPGIAILLAVLGFNLLGDGLRDILDPRLRD